MKKILLLFVCFNLCSSELYQDQIDSIIKHDKIRLEEDLALLKEMVPKSSVEDLSWSEYEQLEISSLSDQKRFMLLPSIITGARLNLNDKSLIVRLLHRLKTIRLLFESEKIDFAYFESLFQDYNFKLNVQKIMQLDDSDLAKQTLKFFISESLKKGYIKGRVNSLQKLSAIKLVPTLCDSLISITELDKFFNEKQLSEGLKNQIFEGVINSELNKFDMHKVVVRDSYIVYREIVSDNEVTFWYEDLVSHEKINLGNGFSHSFDVVPLQNDYFAVIQEKDSARSNKTDDLREVESDDLLSGDVLRIYHKSEKCFEFKDIGHDELVGHVSLILAYSLNTGLRFNSSKYKLSINQRYLVFRNSSNIYLFDSSNGDLKPHEISLDENIKLAIEGVSNKGDIFFRTFFSEVDLSSMTIENFECPFITNFDTEVCNQFSQDWQEYNNNMGSNYYLDEYSGVFYCKDKDQKSITILNSQTEIKLPGELSVIHPRYVSENLIVLVFNSELKGFNLYIKTDLCENIFNSSSFCIASGKVFFFDSAKKKFVLFNTIDNSVQELESLNSLFIGSESDLKVNCAVKCIEKPFVYKDKPFVFFEIERKSESGFIVKDFVLYDFELDLISILPKDAGGIYKGGMGEKLDFAEDMWHKNPTFFASIYLDEKTTKKTRGTKSTNSERDSVKRIKAQDQPSTLEAALSDQSEEPQDEPK